MRNRKLRIEFAVHHLTKDESWWNDVIFLDESKFNLFGTDWRVMYVGRKPNTELRPQNFKPTVKHGGGHVMVWGCISFKSVGNLVFIDGIINRMNSYLKILKNNLKQSAEGAKDTFKLYQDYDSKHNAYKVRSFLLHNCSKAIEPPPQSPNMNPIENLWNKLDRRERQKPVSSITELKKRHLEECNKIGSNYTSKIISNMP